MECAGTGVFVIDAVFVPAEFEITVAPWKHLKEEAIKITTAKTKFILNFRCCLFSTNLIVVSCYIKNFNKSLGAHPRTASSLCVSAAFFRVFATFTLLQRRRKY